MSDEVKLYRCMGGPRCSHIPGSCTATNSEYQAKAKARAEPEAAPVEPLCPFTDRPAWECAAACTCAHFKPTAIIGHAHPPAAPTDALVEKVARALADSDGARWDAADYTHTPSGEDPEDMREGYRQNARAALAAMQKAGE